MKKNLYIVVLTVLFLGAAKLLYRFEVWKIIGVEPPHGYVFQGVLFLALLFILQNTLFGPYVEVLEERENQTDRKKEQAEKTRLEAERLMAEYKSRIEQTRLQAITERERVALDAEKEEHLHLTKSREEAGKAFAEKVLELESLSRKATGELRNQVDVIANDILEQVVSSQTHPRPKPSLRTTNV